MVCHGLVAHVLVDKHYHVHLEERWRLETSPLCNVCDIFLKQLETARHLKLEIEISKLKVDLLLFLNQSLMRVLKGRVLGLNFIEYSPLRFVGGLIFLST
jgi:hypothetical protein